MPSEWYANSTAIAAALRVHVPVWSSEATACKVSSTPDMNGCHHVECQSSWKITCSCKQYEESAETPEAVREAWIKHFLQALGPGT